MMDDKYITFKRSDWDDMVNRVSRVYKDQLDSMQCFALDDAVVIRRKDAFAAAALHTYANSIAITARALGELAPTTRDRLQSIADYFHEQAAIADDTDTRLPD